MLTETPGNAASVQVLASFEGYIGEIYAVKYQPNGTMIASGGNDGADCVWNAEAIGSGPIHTLRGHKKDVLAVAWSPDGRLLATLSYDDSVRLWDMSARVTLAVIECKTACNGRGLSFSPNGSLLAASSSKGARLFDVATLAEAAVLEDGDRTVTELAFSPCGTLIARALATYHPGGMVRRDVSMSAQPLLGDAAHRFLAVFSKVPVTRACGELPAPAVAPGYRMAGLAPGSDPSDSPGAAARSVRHRPG